MITLENLLWLRDTKIGNLTELLNCALKDMTESQREKFLQDFWQNVMVMRHVR